MHDKGLEPREYLRIKRALLKPKKEVQELAKRKKLFRSMCKGKSNYCKLIIDNGSTDNLVSTNMVELLGLKKITHATPYRVSWLQK